MKSLLFLLLLIISTSIYAQAPQAFNYQGIARDVAGTPLANKNVSLRLTIREGGSPGTEVYREEHNVLTNKLGIFNLEVGRGVSQVGLFGNIQWGAGDHFIRVDIDPTGGQNYIPMGTAQLLSVPYALYAGTGNNQWLENPQGIHNSTGNVGIGDTDPSNKLSIVNNVPDGNDRWLLSLDNPSTSGRSFTSMKLTAGEGNSQTDLTHHSTSYDFDGYKYSDFGQLRSSGNGLILRCDANNSVIKFLVGNTGGINILERMRITSTGNIGIGTENPASKLQVSNGDVFIENINNGVILKSPDGNCWRATVQNDGTLKTTAITCPN